MRLYFGAIFGLVLLSLVSVWQEYKVIALGRETEALRKQKRELKQENNTLQFECQRLEEPSRLLRLNKTLGLHLKHTPKQLPKRPLSQKE